MRVPMANNSPGQRARCSSSLPSNHFARRLCAGPPPGNSKAPIRPCFAGRCGAPRAQGADLPGVHFSMPSALSRLDTPELRASVYQFMVYVPGGVASVFLGIWLSEHGLPADQIGIINAVPTLLLLLLNIVVGRLADRADDWRTALIVLSLLSALAPLPLYFVSEFWGILLV